MSITLPSSSHLRPVRIASMTTIANCYTQFSSGIHCRLTTRLRSRKRGQTTRRRGPTAARNCGCRASYGSSPMTTTTTTRTARWSTFYRAPHAEPPNTRRRNFHRPRRVVNPKSHRNRRPSPPLLARRRKRNELTVPARPVRRKRARRKERRVVVGKRGPADAACHLAVANQEGESRARRRRRVVRAVEESLGRRTRSRAAKAKSQLAKR
jgi:hypothetical protein